jgi:enamine deaminase RidA (YjgF/YER057c/UK114 family)
MQVALYDRLGTQWIYVRAEGVQQRDIEDQTTELFQRINSTLQRFDLSLPNTVRTRLWARDRTSRDRGSAIRATTLIGDARSASSSFIASDWLDSDASVGVELWALRPTNRASKTLVEYEPAIVPLRYVAWESVIALSGVTAVLPTLQDQMHDILQRIGETLAHAGAGWRDVTRLSAVLHRSQSLQELRSLLGTPDIGQGAEIEFQFADGYSTEGKLVEIEVTAKSQTG